MTIENNLITRTNVFYTPLQCVYAFKIRILKEKNDAEILLSETIGKTKLLLDSIKEKSALKCLFTSSDYNEKNIELFNSGINGLNDNIKLNIDIVFTALEKIKTATSILIRIDETIRDEIQSMQSLTRSTYSQWEN